MGFFKEGEQCVSKCTGVVLPDSRVCSAKCPLGFHPFNNLMLNNNSFCLCDSGTLSVDKTTCVEQCNVHEDKLLTGDSFICVCKDTYFFSRANNECISECDKSEFVYQNECV